MIFGLSYFQLTVRALGIIGLASTVVGFQCRKHSYVIGLRAANEFIFGIQYILLGGYTGGVLNIMSAVRNILFAERVKQNKSTTVIQIIFYIIFTIAAVLTYAGFSTVLFLVGKLITTYVYGSKNMTLVRIMTMVSIIAAVIRIDIIERKKLKKYEVMK